MVLSIRNNNAGNLRPIGSQSGFQQFSTPQEGLQAMRDDLLIKVSGKSNAMAGKFGQDYQPTLANLINTWAPPTENDTGNYVNFVSQKSGLNPDSVLTPEDVEKILPAMVEMEGGQEAVNHFFGEQDQSEGVFSNDFADFTDEELAEIAGIELEDEFSDISDEELMQIAGIGDEYSKLESFGMGAADGATSGTVDEITGAFGGLTQALAPFFGNQEEMAKINSVAPDSGYNDVYSKFRDDTRAEHAQAREDNPWSYTGGQVTGAIAQAAPAVKGLSSVEKLRKYARNNPLKTAAGTAGVSGYIYGAGGRDGSLQERHEAGTVSGLISAPLGPIGARVSQSLFPRVQKLFTKPPKVVKTAKDIVSSEQVAKLNSGDSVRLPTGVAKGDVKMMRAEEAARQGLLGDEYQAMMNQADDVFKGDVEQAVKILSGGDSSEDLLTSGINRFKSRAAAEKRVASRLMKARNEALAKTKIDKKYIAQTFGDDLAELAQDPQNKPFLATKGSDEIKERFQYLSSLLDNEGDKIGFDELAGWASDLGAYGRSKVGTPEGVFASKVTGKYNEWLDNMARHAIKEGDDGVVDKIFKANKNYAEFKSKYGTNTYKGQSKIIEKIIQQDELTDGHLVNMAFGSSLKGKNETAQIVRRMLFSVPKGAKRDAMRADFRGGLVRRAFENSETPNGFKIGKLRTELGKLVNNEAYKNSLTEPEFNKALTGLIKDLDKYVDATTRRDVYSPSAPMVLRGIEGILNMTGLISAPVGGRMFTEPLKAGVRQGKMAPDRRLVEKSLKGIKELLGETEVRARFYGSTAPAPVIGTTKQKLEE